MLKILFFIAIINILCSCLKKIDYQFKIPANVHVINPNLFENHEIEKIIENPLINKNNWNDSLIKLYKIKKIIIANKSINNPAVNRLELIYCFRKNGTPKSFQIIDNEDNSKIIASNIYKYKNSNDYSITSEIFNHNYCHYSLHHKVLKEYEIFYFEKTKCDRDTLIILKNKKLYQFNIEKFNNKITKIELLNYSKSNIFSCKNFIQNKLHIQSFEDIKVEITTFSNDKPQGTYSTDFNWNKTKCIRKWKYNSKGMLVNLKIWEQNNLSKNFNFKYGKNDLLEKFQLNNQQYTIKYL
ncbi:MAG: hypothetical protein HYR91_11775 [Flavobacteriia bacterium]|nr:hypothetical protein [Flavobacteriia bacterium]